MEQALKLILGAPGTGKTTRALAIMEQELADGVRPERLAFVSFTRKAAHEALDRALTKFNFVKGQLPLFRTLHSMANRELNLSRTDIMTSKNYREFANTMGVELSGYYEVEEGLPVGAKEGDQMLFVEALARARCVPLDQQWHELREPMPWHELKQFAAAFKAYKTDSGLVDYTDMIEEYIANGQPVSADVAIVDEAQDLCQLQWRMVKHAFSNVKRIYIAGDDDQAIYRWSGADVEIFLQLKGEQEVLAQSYRLPSTVHTFADTVIKRVSERYAKHFAPRTAPGNVAWHRSIDGVDFGAPGSHMVLARNAYMLRQPEEYIRAQGCLYSTKRGSSVKAEHVQAIVSWTRLDKGEEVTGANVKAVYDHLQIGEGVARGFKSCSRIADDTMYKAQQLRDEFGLKAKPGIWHDVLTGIDIETREYYLAVLRSGEKLTAKPRIHLSTIHGVKGGEADNVTLFTDMAPRTYADFQVNPDDEHRTFYVGVTRARDTLNMLFPQTTRYYPL